MRISKYSGEPVPVIPMRVPVIPLRVPVIVCAKQGFWAFSTVEKSGNFQSGRIASQVFDSEPRIIEMTNYKKKKNKSKTYTEWRNVQKIWCYGARVLFGI